AHLRVQPRAAIRQVVTRDAGHGRVPQAHGGDGLRDPARLALVEWLRLAGVDLAEVTPPGALLAADEEGRLAVLPALEDVRAAGLLADRVQALALDQVAQVRVLGAHLRPGLDPGRLLLDRGGAVAHLEPQQLAAVRAHGDGAGAGAIRGGGAGGCRGGDGGVVVDGGHAGFS